MSREAIIGHETAWKVSSFGVAQYLHGYDPALLAAIEEAALKLKASHAVHKHLDLTFITGADRYIPEIRELLHDKLRLERLSDMMGTKLEPYPLSIVGSTVTFMNPGTAPWSGIAMAFRSPSSFRCRSAIRWSAATSKSIATTPKPAAPFSNPAARSRATVSCASITR
ncbi:MULTISPECIES: hypothetical protein [unclassified Mesorhizobium]|nr:MULTISPECIES: hypothetical protein [unclassified Mesorhizobium]